MRKTPSGATKADFGPFLAKKGPFFTLFFSFFNTKNQKMLMSGFSRKWAGTYGRTRDENDINIILVKSTYLEVLFPKKETTPHKKSSFLYAPKLVFWGFVGQVHTEDQIAI